MKDEGWKGLDLVQMHTVNSWYMLQKHFVSASGHVLILLIVHKKLIGAVCVME